MYFILKGEGMIKCGFSAWLPVPMCQPWVNQCPGKIEVLRIWSWGLKLAVMQQSVACVSWYIDFIWNLLNLMLRWIH